MELTAKPEGTTSFNRKNVMIGLGVVALIFTVAFVYGISTASTAQKNKQQDRSQVETVDTSPEHLKNAPDSYGDSKTKKYDQKSDGEKKSKQKKLKKPEDDVEYIEPERRPAPAYTRIPVSNYTPRTTPMPRVAAPNMGAARGGLTPEQKIEAEKQKEKMAANQSPIGFKLDEEEKK
ncbi:hypothetical protein [Selenomonas ruminantium]|uniref:hypothetical protein n=1 Tax=Selenomonas ruminantium TaxID=971 RepID=UPI00116029BB|nr:hypothetical protein [Selenomonas ruminantium]